MLSSQPSGGEPLIEPDEMVDNTSTEETGESVLRSFGEERKENQELKRGRGKKNKPLTAKLREALRSACSTKPQLPQTKRFLVGARSVYSSRTTRASLTGITGVNVYNSNTF